MAFRELTMIDVREVLRRYQAQQGVRRIARETGLDRKTVRRYLVVASEHGLSREQVLDDATVHAIARVVQERTTCPPSEQRALLHPHRARIEAWLSGETPLRLTKVHELLERRGVVVSYGTLRRFVVAELGWHKPRATVRIDDPPPGEEAQVDFGAMGWLRDETGRRRRLWALIVTLSTSRHMFVWPTLTQTVADACEGLDAAWRFFGGRVQRIVIDNLKPVVAKADALEPTLSAAFVEYAQARELFVDAARVRRPKDKPRVENQVAYVRESCFAGETFVDLDDARRAARLWCENVAGRRVHGTTRRVPADEFARIELPALRPPPTAPFDVPRWSEAKVHPDHHLQVARALYSMPTRYIGCRVRVRIDTKLVRIYLGTELIKTHAPQPPGGRSTDPGDYPKDKAAYAFKDVDRLREQARARGIHVGELADHLLARPLPWRHMRQVYALLRLCERYGPARVDEVCRRALAFEVFEVRRIKGLLERAHRDEQHAAARGTLIQLPLRFARDTTVFVTRRPDGEEDAR